MPNRVVISKLGGSKVLEYQKYKLSDSLDPNFIRIKQNRRNQKWKMQHMIFGEKRAFEQMPKLTFEQCYMFL